MRLLITTPAVVAVDRPNVMSVRAEDASGSFGIFTGHTDFLTALTICVIAWEESDRVRRFCAVRHGVFAVRGGQEVTVATREALVGDDLEQLESVVLTSFRQAAEAEAISRTESLKMQMAAVRQIVRYLRPNKSSMFGGGP